MEKLQPKLRFPEYSGNWDSKLINEILSIGSGRDYKHLEKGDIPVFGTGGLMTYVNDYLYEGETVCIGRKGTIDKPMYFNGKIWTVDTLFYTNKFKNSSPKFVYNLFQRINWKEYNEASGVPSLSKSTIEKIEINIPSLEEQTKIANFLSSVDEKLNLLKEKKTLLEDYKNGIMQKIFNQEIRFKDDNGNDFEDWEEKTLGEVGDVITGKTPSTSDSELWNGDIQFITPTDINEGNKYQESTARYVTNNSKLKILPANSLVYTCIASIGKMCITKYPAITNQQINSLVINDLYNNEYVYYWLLYITPLIKSTQANTTLPIINKTDFSKFSIQMPSLKEQTKIANFLSSIDEKIELVSNQIQDTLEYKKGLLQQMFV